MRRPTEFEFMQARAYARRIDPDSPDYHQAKAACLYARFYRGVEAVAEYLLRQRIEERNRELREWLAERGSSREPPADASSTDTSSTGDTQ